MKWWFYALLFSPFAVTSLYLQYVANSHNAAFWVFVLALWTAWLTSGHLKP